MYILAGCIACLALWTRLSVAWTVPVSMDLAWPPIDVQGYHTQNGQLVEPAYVWPNIFPCISKPPSADQQRTPFPVTGARLQYNLTNSTGQDAGDQFMANSYFGQMDVDVLANKSAYAYIEQDDARNIRTQQYCGDSINATYTITPPQSPMFTWSSYDLVGTNATIGVQITFFDGDNNVEEMWQCSYITFVAADAPVTQDRGVCNSGVYSVPGVTTSVRSTTIPTSSVTTSRSSGWATTVVGGGTGSATTSFIVPTTSTTNPVLVGAEHSLKGTSIGVAVGVSLAVALGILGLGYWLLRRKRAHKGTVALDFFTRGRPWAASDTELKDAKGGEKSQVVAFETDIKNVKGKGKGKMVEDSDQDSVRASTSVSVHSQQLPSYQEALGDDESMKETTMKKLPDTKVVDAKTLY